MRLLSLLGVAAQAESFRLRRTASMTARRAAWMVAAALFAVAAVGLGHAAAIAELALRFGLAAAFGIVALADLVVAGILMLMGRQKYDALAQEALELRRSSLAAATRNPMSEAAAFAFGSAPAPMLGAMAGEAIAAWLRRR